MFNYKSCIVLTFSPNIKEIILKKQKLIMLLSNYFWVFTLRIASKLKINLRQLIKCGVLLIIQIKEEIKVDSNWNGIITK